MSPLRAHLRPRDDGKEHTWKVLVRNNKSLPLTQREVRFAVCRDDGRTSRPWKIDAQANGEVYIRGRDCFGEGHVSLHASGQAHIKSAAGDRSADVPNWIWRPGQIALHILFGPWSCPIADHAEEKIWGRNQLLLGVEDDWGVAVSFMRAPSDHDVGPPTWCESRLLARMDMRDVNETLWVIAYQIRPPFTEAELNKFLRKEVRRSLRHELQSLPESKTILDVQLHGITPDGVGYVIPHQARVSTSYFWRVVLWIVRTLLRFSSRRPTSTLPRESGDSGG